MSKFERSKLSTKAQDEQKEVLFRTEKERIAMTLNTESEIASGLLIQRLTELYEKPVEAAVRETVSNALDAVAVSHSGEEPVVEITTPTALSPVFEVKDNGVGMTYEDIKNVYAKYGSSTKSEDFEQIGAYGLGAKSPLAYGNEFTVTSVKDGEKSIIIVAREDFTNYIKVVDVTKTDEPSGTTVSIPVKSSDINEFQEYIETYKTVPSDVKIVVDGKYEEQTTYAMLTDKFVIHEDENGPIHAKVWIHKERANQAVEILDLGQKDRDYAYPTFNYVLGGWIYKNPSKSNHSYSYYLSDVFLVELKPGIVSFNSSRDAIIPNERIYQLINRVNDYILNEKIISDIASALSKVDTEYYLRFVGHVIGNPVNLLLNFDTKDIKFQVSSSANIAINKNEIEFNGFSITDSIEKMKKYDGKFHILYKEHTRSSAKTPTNSLHYDDIESSWRSSWMIESRIGDIMKFHEESILDGRSMRHSITTLLATISELHRHGYGYYYESKRIKHFVVITDVNESNYDIIRKRRKQINQLHYKEENEARDVLVLTTSMNKEQTEDVLSSLMLDVTADSINYYTPEKLDEIIKKEQRNKASKKQNSPRKVNFGADVIEARHYQSNMLENIYRGKKFDDYEPSTSHVFTVIGKSTYIPSSAVHSYIIWYANENNVDIEDVTLLYAYSNNFRRSDLLTLMEYGPVYNTDSCNEDLSNVKLYKEKIKDNKVQRQWAVKSSPTRSEEMLLSLIASLSRERINGLESSYNYVRENANNIAEDMGLPKIPSVDFGPISRLKYIPEFSSSYGCHLSIDQIGESIYEQLEYLDREYKDAVTYALLLLTDLRHVYTITDDNKIIAEEVRDNYRTALNVVEQIPKNAPKFVIKHFETAAMIENEMLRKLANILNKAMERIDMKAE